MAPEERAREHENTLVYNEGRGKGGKGFCGNRPGAVEETQIHTPEPAKEGEEDGNENGGNCWAGPGTEGGLNGLQRRYIIRINSGAHGGAPGMFPAPGQ